MFVRVKNIKSKDGEVRPYAYLVENYWHKELQAPRQRVIKYLGRLDIGTYNIKDLNLKECAYCKSKDNLVPDHIIPLTLGGKNTLDNIQCLCSKCNSKKRDLLDREVTVPMISIRERYSTLLNEFKN